MKVRLEQIPEIVKTLIDTGRQDEARNAADSFLKFDQHDPAALFWRGWFYRLTGNLNGAQMDFATAATVMPHEPTLREAVKSCMEQLGNTAGWAELKAMLDREAELNGGFQTMPSIEPVKWLEKTIYVPRYPLRDPIAKHIRGGAIHDQPVYDTLKGFIKPGDVMLDVGANFGLMSTLFADLVGKDGKVYSFEANPYNFHILTLNMKTNGLTQVEPVFRAVMDVTDQMLSFPAPDFSIYPSHGSFSVSPDKNAGYPINSITIDAMQIERHIAAMKVDIQGADLLALRGAVETIKRHRMPILVEYEEDLQKPFGTGFQDYVDFTASIGYCFDKVVDSINFLLLPR